MDELSSTEVETPTPVADTPAPTEAAKPSAPVDDNPASKAEAQEKALNDDLRKAFRNANRERQEDGKFAPKDGKPAPADKLDTAKPPAEAKPIEAKAPEAEKPAEPAKPVVPPPNSWSKEAKADWDKLPPQVQEHIAQREAQSHKAISELGQFAKAYEPVHNTIRENYERIRASGKDVGTYTDHLFKADAALERDPVGFIKMVAEAKGIDLAALSDPFAIPSTDAQSQQITAQLNAAMSRVEHLERQLADTRYKVEGREAQEYQARQSSYEAEVTKFSADKVDFQDLINDIVPEVKRIRDANPTLAAKDVLQEAYDRARWANPATRAKLLAEQQAEADKKRLEAGKRDAELARRASAINVNGSVPMKAQASYDDDLRAIWRRANA